jgi:ParB-like chromosome segregation protein Spo0J
VAEERIPRVDQRMTIEYRDPKTLTPHPQNYRAHPPEQVAEICKSIRAHGQVKNIIVNPEGVILCGHGVVQAAREMGQPEVAVFVFDGTEAEQRKVMVADNELSRMAEDDERSLMSLLREIDEDFGDLRGTGWDEREMQDKLQELAAEDFEQKIHEEFHEYDPDAMELEHVCPKCGYEW